MTMNRPMSYESMRPRSPQEYTPRVKKASGPSLLKNPEVRAAIDQVRATKPATDLYIVRPRVGAPLAATAQRPVLGEYLIVQKGGLGVVLHRADGTTATVIQNPRAKSLIDGGPGPDARHDQRSAMDRDLDGPLGKNGQTALERDLEPDKEPGDGEQMFDAPSKVEEDGGSKGMYDEKGHIGIY